MIDPASSDGLSLRAAETRLRLALQAARIGIWEYDITTGALFWDARVREVVEAEPDVSPTWAEHFLPAIHPNDVDRVQGAFATVLAGTDAALDIEFRVVGARSGSVTWTSLTGQLDDGPSGRRIVGTARDITAEHDGIQLAHTKASNLEARIAEALRERQIWADIVEGTSDPIAAIDTELNLIALNRAYVEACERLFGVQLTIGANLFKVLSHMPEARDAAAMLWKHALAGNVFDLNETGEAGGAGKFYDIKFSPMRDPTGVIVGAFQSSRDVSARVAAKRSLKETADALQRAQKMEAIGNLAGGIAHDFNNLLQVVSGNLQLLGRDIAGNERAERRVSNAMQGVLRGAKLAAQLLAFGRRQALEPKIVNVGRLVLVMDDLLRRALAEGVEIETSISGGLWNTLVDPAQVENAVLNLAINGRDAMDGQGKLTVEVANAVLDDAYSRANAEVRAGQYVMIAVTDTGSGMTPELIERVFEPFFSTKPEGHGTGLGLSMVHGLVKQSNGHVKIYSEVGEGTTVKMYLPRAHGIEDRDKQDHPSDFVGGDATILVVEDDEQVREMAVGLLRELGYATLVAADAENALRIVEGGAAIDLIFTDVVMPGPVRSVELARKAQEQLPNVVVLFTSGYTRNAIVHGGRLDPGVELLTKPYTRESLSRKVAQLLASKRHAPQVR